VLASCWPRPWICSANAARIVGTLGNGFYALAQVVTLRSLTPSVRGDPPTHEVAGARAVAMEASSHGLYQGRVAAPCLMWRVLVHPPCDHLIITV
jgi:UDP-N-acetylmuramoyl-L-alanyl-D-glutamate--2,6-diaminopimelate ligase